MPRKKAVSRTETRADIIDKIFTQVDPEIVAAGLLGAVAARGGLVPPLTQLLMSVTADGGVAESIKETWMDVAKLGSVGWMAGEFTYTNLQTLVGLFSPPANATDDEKKGLISSQAIMASGAMEGMMMMAFMKNKEAQRTLIEAVKGIGEVIPL